MEILIIAGIAAAIAFIIGYASQETKVTEARAEAQKVRDQLREVQELFNDTLRSIRADSVLLPSLVRWADSLEEAHDKAVNLALRTKKYPAHKAAEEVRLASAAKRQVKRELRIALNRIDLYESLAPWVLEYTELSIGELLEAAREEEGAKASAERGEDPVERYVPKAEWKKLSTSQRNQRALERYCDPKRKRTPWAAGIEYERYVGYTYEKQGYSVEYQGALRGKEDIGIDLICENDAEILAVQCKRISPDKAIPVRENVIAQIFGSAEFHRMISGKTKPVCPVLVTTYQLSDEARRFAEHLHVQVKELAQLKPYPMIKCNVSPTGRKIYHLPMDQQYDRVIVGNRKGEFYVKTVIEAERAGFRRAFRWKGDKKSGAV